MIPRVTWQNMSLNKFMGGMRCLQLPWPAADFGFSAALALLDDDIFVLTLHTLCFLTDPVTGWECTHVCLLALAMPRLDTSRQIHWIRPEHPTVVHRSPL
jgi:hypothetical protein